MSRLRSTIVAALVLSLLAGSTVAVAAQPADEVTPAARGRGNADRVDGKHAVSATGQANKRAGKLVATNKQGLLPSNILTPLWSLLQGIPAVLADGLVGFDEIAGMPAGFTDGVDDGITAMTFTQVVATTALAAGANGTATATCPAGSAPISGGHTATSFLVFNVSSLRTGTGWIVAARNSDLANAQTLTAVAYCLSTVPSTAAITIAKKSGGIKPATANRPPTPKKRK